MSKMTTAHILAAARYVRAGTGEFGPLNRSGCDGFTNGEWLSLFQAELLRRARLGVI